MNNAPVNIPSLCGTHLLRFRASGQSMIPTIWDGDQVQLERTNQLSPGETLVYLENKKLVAHRAIFIDDQTVWTRGDNQRGAPLAVPRAAILGRVIKVSPPPGISIKLKRQLWMRLPKAMTLASRIKQQLHRRLQSAA